MAASLCHLSLPFLCPGKLRETHFIGSPIFLFYPALVSRGG